MLLQTHLQTICKNICNSNYGNLSESIIQNIFIYQLQKNGFQCQKEVVVPVIVDNMFVGHNRLDIVITHQKKCKTKVSIIEFKTLCQSVLTSSSKEKIFAQCHGYTNCMRKFFDKKTNIQVLLINIWKKKNEMSRKYEFDIIKVMTSNLKNQKTKNILKKIKDKHVPIPILYQGEEHFEVDEIIEQTVLHGKKMVLVKWVGCNTVSWEPQCNMPKLVLFNYKKKIERKKNRS